MKVLAEETPKLSDGYGRKMRCKMKFSEKVKYARMKLTFNARGVGKRTRRFLCDNLPFGKKDNQRTTNRIARQVLRILRKQRH